jgi:hypothetical protein
MTSKEDSEVHLEAAETLKTAIAQSAGSKAPVSLDELIELLDADDLRHVVGMLRPKGQPGAA